MTNEDKILSILKEIGEISEFLSGGYDDTNGDALSWYISKINAYLARMPRLEAEAEALLNIRKGEAADDEAGKAKKEQMAATLFRESILKKTAVEEKTYKFVYRLNQNTIEILKGVITQLSYMKSQAPPKISGEMREEIQKMHKQIEKLERKIEDKL